MASNDSYKHGLRVELDDHFSLQTAHINLVVFFGSFVPFFLHGPILVQFKTSFSSDEVPIYFSFSSLLVWSKSGSSPVFVQVYVGFCPILVQAQSKSSPVLVLC